MRILLVHNRYQEGGGEDVVFEAEAGLLERRGHSVTRLVFDNATISEHRSPLTAARLAASTVWSRSASLRVRHTARDAMAEVVHFHNTFPLVSPAAYSAAKAEGAAVVQTLHNYRLLCPSAVFFRSGHICEDCLGKTPPWPGVVHGCYRGSRSQTAAVATMLSVHRLRRTWSRDVDLFIALTEFARRKFVAGGLPADRVVVKGNFVAPDPGAKTAVGDFILYVGRLTEEKGIPLLLRAWTEHSALPPLRIVGDGPLAPLVERVTADQPNIKFLGRIPRPDVLALMHAARALVFPSEWYEGFPVTLVESFACGLPVIASRLGAMAEIVEDGTTGLLFDPGDAADLARQVESAWTRPDALARVGYAGRDEFERNFTEERTYHRLIALYEQAVSMRARPGG